jgi:uncharacterized protein
MHDGAPEDALALLDWRRRVAELYAEIRSTPDPGVAWKRWNEERSRLFREHPQSPVRQAERAAYDGPHVFQYDPSRRAVASLADAAPLRFELPTSDGGVMAFTRFARAHFTIDAIELGLDLYWLDGYAGGLFLPFADTTSGGETYGAGRYVLDTAKGADLGEENRRLVLDFNFAYQPSCSYDPRWSCPLAPAANRLGVAVRAGERLGRG